MQVPTARYQLGTGQSVSDSRTQPVGRCRRDKPGGRGVKRINSESCSSDPGSAQCQRPVVAARSREDSRRNPVALDNIAAERNLMTSPNCNERQQSSLARGRFRRHHLGASLEGFGHSGEFVQFLLAVTRRMWFAVSHQNCEEAGLCVW